MPVRQLLKVSHVYFKCQVVIFLNVFYVWSSKIPSLREVLHIAEKSWRLYCTSAHEKNKNKDFGIYFGLVGGFMNS